MKTMIRRMAAGLAMLATFSLTTATQAAPPVDWSRNVTQSAIGGYALGNPAAKTRLIEYVSYTCPHCGHYVTESSEPLKSGWVKPGTVVVEMRNAVRDRFDLTAALLARCGGKTKFFGNHLAIFANQKAWFDKLNSYQLPPGTSDPVAAMKDVGRRTGLYDLLAKRGLTPAQLDVCLADQAQLKQVLAMTNNAWNEVKIAGTPGFTLNGKLLENTATWDAVRQALPAAAARP